MISIARSNAIAASVEAALAEANLAQRCGSLPQHLWPFGFGQQAVNLRVGTPARQQGLHRREPQGSEPPLRRNLESAALGILRDPVDELLRFAFAPRIDCTVEAVHQFACNPRNEPRR